MIDLFEGLGAEDVMFETSNPKWIDVLKKWERGRKAGDLPPGVAKNFVTQSSDDTRDYRIRDGRWLSRPEVRTYCDTISTHTDVRLLVQTLESIFLLWRTTKDPVWRERGWKIFQAIEKYSRTEYGYGSVAHVDVSGAASKMNSQPR